MGFHQARRTKMLRRCFTCWCILRMEAVLERQEEEVVEEKYFQRASRKESLRKCFEGWLMMIK